MLKRKSVDEIALYIIFEAHYSSSYRERIMSQRTLSQKTASQRTISQNTISPRTTSRQKEDYVLCLR
jgi:hypothetical protein